VKILAGAERYETWETASASLSNAPTRTLETRTALDVVLGGNWQASGVVLLAGERGAGKSTLALQVLIGVVESGLMVHFHAGEQSIEDIARTLRRLDVGRVLDANPHQLIITTGERLPEAEMPCGEWPHLIIVDSIQTMKAATNNKRAGSITQVAEVADELVGHAKEIKVEMLLIGQFTKGSGVAGPSSLGHAVDAVVTLQNINGARVLCAVKNRFGPSDEPMILDMTATGLVAPLTAKRSESSLGAKLWYVYLLMWTGLVTWIAIDVHSYVFPIIIIWLPWYLTIKLSAFTADIGNLAKQASVRRIMRGLAR
jgi:DNA repair protein RadA/Sms